MYEVEEERQETTQTAKVVGSRTNAETGKLQHATGFYVTRNDEGVPDNSNLAELWCFLLQLCFRRCINFIEPPRILLLRCCFKRYF